MVFGLKTYIAEIISFTKDRLDIIIVGYFISTTEMGVFTFSYSFASGILILSSVMMQNFSPIISELWFQKKYNRLINKINSIKLKIVYIQSLFFVIIILGFNFVMPLITELPINEYLLIFNILLIGFFIFSCSSWLGSFLIMTNNLNLNIIRISVILLFSISLILVLTYNYGVLGAAIAISLSSGFSFFIINFLVARVIKGKI